MDFEGKVEAVEEEVKNYKVGERVHGLTGEYQDNVIKDLLFYKDLN